MDTTPRQDMLPLAAGAERRYNRVGIIALVILLVLAVAGNVALLAALGGDSTTLLEGRTENSDDYGIVHFLDPNRALVGTLSNQLLLLNDGEVVAEAPFTTPITGIIATPDDSTIYVGTSDGQITMLDAQLNVQGEPLAVNGRVVGLKALGEDGFLVGHGIGPFSDQYWVTRYAYGATEPDFSTRVEFTISALDASADTAFYGTANARTGAISLADGEKLWSTTVSRPITKLIAVDEGGVLVGDERGNLSLINSAGEVSWEVNVTGYQLRGLNYDSTTDTYFAGDSEGDLYAVNSSGEPMLTMTVADSNIEGIYALETGQKIIVPRRGNWQTLNPAALSGAGAAQQVQTAQLAFNLGTVLALIIAAVYTIEKLRSRTGKQLFRMWRGRIGYFLLLPSLILILVFGYYPAFMAIYYSFTNFSAGGVVEFIGLDNYIRILTQDRFFGIGFGNMVLIVITNIIKVITMPLLIAELIFWLKNEGRRYLFRTLYLLPAVVPGLVIVYMWRMVYDPYDGLLNRLLQVFGVNASTAWLANEQTALWAIIGAGFPWIGAFPLLIYMGGLLNINSELFEAARIDGANWWVRFWRIDFPLLRPQTMLLVFFAFNGAVSGFEHIFVFTRGGPGIATYVPGLQMYFRIAEGEFGYASAIGAILFIIVFIGTLVLVGNKRFAIALDND
ncbi:MAG: hypothetical protein CL610_25485 [Anaerolineaceae bacterium]|nr:hypothetical protein [Anaerolineaceae bacterium]